MAPPVAQISVVHRIRNAHPLRIVMRRQLERLEHADSAEIRKSQERRLRALVRVVAARSPFYREYFRESGVNPRSIRTLEDLPQLPLLTRDHLLERIDDFRVYPRRLMWTARSSGTSGRPIGVYRTPGSSVYELCALEQQWGWFGLRPGARRVILRGSDFAATEPGKLTKAIPGARQLLVSSFHLIPSNLDAIMHDVRAFEPDAIEGWPSSIALLAALLRERGREVSCQGGHHLVGADDGGAGGAHRGRVQRARHRPLRPDRTSHDGRNVRTRRLSRVSRLRDRRVDAGAEYGVAMGVGRHPATQLGVSVVPVPHRRRSRPSAHAALSVRSVISAPWAGRRAGRRFLHRRRRTADTATVMVVDDLSGVREAQIAQLAQGRYEVRVAPAAGFDESAVEESIRRNVEHVIGAGQHVTVRIMPRIPRSNSGKLKPSVVEGDGSS